MKLPLLILGVMAVVAGFVPFSQFVTSDGRALETHLHITFSIAPVLLALCGILMAMRFYKSQNGLAARVSSAFGKFYRAAYSKFYVDEIYLFITKKVIFNLIGKPSAWADKNVVDGMVNASGMFAQDGSDELSIWQSGKLQDYAFWFLAGVISLSIVFAYFLN